jgi:hypothetical protein
MEKYVIWGCGACGNKVYEMLKSLGNIEVVAFADSKQDLIGKTNQGITIKAPEEVVSMAKRQEFNSIVFAFANLHQRDATRLFKGIEKIKAYVVPRYVQEFFERYDSPEKCLVEIDLSKPRMKQFDVNLVDHCNMKCKGCLRFSNLVTEPKFADYDQMIRDWKRIKELFWGVERLKLMGGEPMLSPDLCRYIKSAREIFPDADIMVTTNALLINKNCTELFHVMKENYCFFDISLYAPMEKRIRDIEKLLDENGVWYFINNTKGDFYKVMSRTPDYDADEMYAACTAKNCHHLREGKISVCSRPQYAYIINERYGTNIPGTDGVWDIYNLNLDAWELDEKLSSSFEACKYCAPPVSYEWGRADDKTAKQEDWFVN